MASQSKKQLIFGHVESNKGLFVGSFDSNKAKFCFFESPYFDCKTIQCFVKIRNNEILTELSAKLDFFIAVLEANKD